MQGISLLRLLSISHAIWVMRRELIDYLVCSIGRPVFSQLLSLDFGEYFLFLGDTVWGRNLILMDSCRRGPSRLAILILEGELSLPVKGPQEVLSD